MDLKHKGSDLVILLTGTITPNSLYNLKINDPLLRRQHYLEAIHYYLSKTKYKIVFTENSADLLENFPFIPNRIEYLTFCSLPIKPDRGIGYKELEIIDFAFRNSDFIKDAKTIVKITGRLKVLNFNHLATKFQKISRKNSCLVFAHSFKSKNMDSRCFFFTKDFWPYLKTIGEHIDKEYNFELCLWDSIFLYQKKKSNRYVPLSPPLRIKGMSGSFGNKYRDSLILHYGRYIRNFLIRLIGKRLKM